MICPSCGGELSPSHKFCPSCGTPSGPISQAPTASAAVAGEAPIAAPVGRLISSDSLPIGGFTPGTILAGRYRIIGLIGRGGMGEVYRADDLKLGQPVALKFLPKALADDSVRRERLFAEVRIARQVSHPNICRVYDISELEGRHFLTMEYIDGEDLASLLKRIGSLHGAKALDVARQLCAGLAAAHDKGVLHRDLKPANVMIDGRGRVRVTDFGLAVVAEEEIPEGDVSGTPPYMAPEQFAGKGASVRSDIYALGLVFYEVFTGKRAFEAKTLAELRAKKETSSPTAPSEIVRDIDPIVERVILRCIDKDPRQRPASAAQVASALPGGDPLAAAIAAGETPSPEMVAASGSTEGLKPWIAWACLAFIIFGIGAAVLLGRKANLFERVPVDKPPEFLVEKAREILRNAGYSNPPYDSAFGFESNDAYFQQMEKKDRSPKRFEKLPAFAIQFWYRQSPQPIEHLGVSSPSPFKGEGISLTDPPPIKSGESVIWLDSRGNLTGLQVIPSEEPRPPGATSSPDWSVLFKAAGLNQEKYTPVEPDWAYLAYGDKRVAWTGTLTDLPSVPVRIEAASWQGKPVSWRMTVPSLDGLVISKTPPSSTLQGQARSFDRIRYIWILILFGGLSVFARRNLRMGRGDRRGATRLACSFFALRGIAWIFGEHHVATIGEMPLLLSSVAIWFMQSLVTWLMYIAVEPFVRRRWPGMLVGWSRLLAGSFRDPVVGRDLLVGCVVGVAYVLLSRIPLASLLDAPQVRPATGNWLLEGVGTLYLFSSTRAVIAGALHLIFCPILVGIAGSFALFLARILLRTTWAAVIVFMLLSIAVSAAGNWSLFALIPVVLVVAVNVIALFRFGLLTFVADFIFFSLFLAFPITTQSTWYSGIGLTGLALLLAMTLYAFYTSLGGQPLIGRASLED